MKTLRDMDTMIAAAENLSRDMVLETLAHIERQFLRGAAARNTDDSLEWYLALDALCVSIQEDLFKLVNGNNEEGDFRLAIADVCISINILRTYCKLKASGRTFRTLAECITVTFREERERVMAVKTEGDDDD